MTWKKYRWYRQWHGPFTSFTLAVPDPLWYGSAAAQLFKTDLKVFVAAASEFRE